VPSSPGLKCVQWNGTWNITCHVDFDLRIASLFVFDLETFISSMSLPVPECFALTMYII